MEFDLDIWGQLIYKIIIILGGNLIVLLLLLIKKIIKREEKKTSIIVGIIVIIIVISSLVIIFKYRHISKLHFENTNIDKIEICWDDCVTVDLTEEEENIIKEELSEYYFTFDEDYFSSGWNGTSPNPTFISRSANISISGTNILYVYYSYNLYDYGEGEEYIIGFKKNNEYYTNYGKNSVTDIFDKYVIEYQDILNKEE